MIVLISGGHPLSPALKIVLVAFVAVVLVVAIAVIRKLWRES